MRNVQKSSFVLLPSCCRPASAQGAGHRSALPQGSRNPMNCPSLGYYLCLGYHPLPRHRGRRRIPPSHNEHHRLCDSTPMVGILSIGCEIDDLCVLMEFVAGARHVCLCVLEGI